MLVLSRHRNEQIVIGNDVVITVVDIRGDKVRLGIDCDRATPVHRREVWLQINANSETTSVSREAGGGQTPESSQGGDGARASA